MIHPLRKVQQSSNTGSVKSERVRLSLTINVEDIHFEAEAGVLRLKGTNVSENPHVKVCIPSLLWSWCYSSAWIVGSFTHSSCFSSRVVEQLGAYHTIDLEMNRKFTLHKFEWDAVARERLEVATNPARTADVAAVIMAEGLAQVCLITSSMTIVRQRIESSIPRKRKGTSSLHEKVPAMPIYYGS